MKKIFILLFWFFLFRVEAQTPFKFNFIDAHGVANPGGVVNTGGPLMQAWPPNNNYTAYGTNIVYGGQIIVLTNLNGAGTNFAYANTYRILFTNVFPNIGFFVNIPDTPTQIDLSTTVTNIAMINASGNNAWGGVRGLVTDSTLEFLSTGVLAGGALTSFQITSGGVTSITLSNGPAIILNSTTNTWLLQSSNLFNGTVTATNITNLFAGTFQGSGLALTNLNATNVVSQIQPTNTSWAEFFTNALVTNCPSTQLWTNNTGGFVTGQLRFLPTVITVGAYTNFFSFSIISTNEAGGFTNTFSTQSTNKGYMTNMSFDITVSNTTVISFLTTCSTNETYNLRVGFIPWFTK